MEKTQTKPEGEEKVAKTSFWKTVPGILTGTAALVTALGALIAAADKAGFLTTGDSPPPKVQSADSNPSNVVTTGDESPVIQGVGGDVTIKHNQ